MARESNLKKRCRAWVEYMYGGRLVQVSAKGVIGYPDSELLIPGYRPVKVEFKAPGKALRPEQIRWRAWLIDNGFLHWSIDDYIDFTEQCERLIKEHRL